MYRTRLFTVVAFAGVLAFGTAALSQCSRGIQPGGLPVTTTTSTSTSTTTTVPPTTTTTAPRVVGDPSEEMISVTPTGAAASYPDGSWSAPGEASMTPDGRYVAFASTATNLVPDDTNGLGDIFVRDRVAGTTERVSVRSDGSEVTSADVAGTIQSDDAGNLPRISADGRYVVFESSARLVPADTDNGIDVYRFDRSTGTTDLVSVSPTGGGSNSTNSSGWPWTSISGDGRYVVFQSDSTLLAPNDTDPVIPTTTTTTTLPGFPPPPPAPAPGTSPDVFMRDMVLGTTTLISTGPGGSGGAAGFSPVITPDGRYIAYQSSYVTSSGSPNNDLVLYDRTTGSSEVDAQHTTSNLGPYFSPAISADGNVVAFLNGQLYARNRSQGTTSLVDTDRPDFTPDREIAWSGGASLSADGRYVAFMCWCQRVVDGPSAGMGHQGVYRADLITGDIIEVDADASGIVANNISYAESSHEGITSDGTSILFGSFGDNLVGEDLNNHSDIFVSTPH
jgi:Tol biopolymer transport system component